MLETCVVRRLAGLRGMVRIAALVLAASTTTLGDEPASVSDRERAGLGVPQSVVETPDDRVPDDAGRVIPGPLCCPDWSHYAIVDALFLQRDNSLINRPLVIDNGTSDPDAAGAVLLTTRDLQYATAPGTRIFFGEYGPDSLGWEIGYLGVYGMYADAGVVGPDTLQVPGELGQLVGSGFDDAVQIRTTTVSSLNMVEANVFTYRCCRTGGRCAKLPWDRCHCACTCSNWLLGLRWAGLDETANLDITCCEGDPASPYRVTTGTQMIGPQVGYRRRKEWACWAYEGWAKVGLMGTVLTQSQGAVYEPFVPLEPVLVREPQSSSRGGVGMIGDMNFTVIRRLDETWGLRMGYNLIWLTGAALAANQWDFTDAPTSGTAVVGGGSLLLHGANLGLEARW